MDPVKKKPKKSNPIYNGFWDLIPPYLSTCTLKDIGLQSYGGIGLKIPHS